MSSVNGAQETTQVNLTADGKAEVTVEDNKLGKRSFNGALDISDGNFNVKEGDQNMTLGKIVSANKDLVVLQRGDTTMSFTRP